MAVAKSSHFFELLGYKNQESVSSVLGKNRTVLFLLYQLILCSYKILDYNAISYNFFLSMSFVFQIDDIKCHH